MTCPHPPQTRISPDNSQKRSPLLEGRRLRLTASLAAFTHSRGIPQSGTGTATHSSWGLITVAERQRYDLPLGPRSETRVRRLRLRLNHHTPYVALGSRRAATSGKTSSLISAKEWGLYTSSSTQARKNVRSHRAPPPGAGRPSRSKVFLTACMVIPSTPIMRKIRRTTDISGSATT